jgi:hypothetical protein
MSVRVIIEMMGWTLRIKELLFAPLMLFGVYSVNATRRGAPNAIGMRIDGKISS